MTRLILIIEAIAPGLGIDGGKRVRASAIAKTVDAKHAQELARVEISRGHAGRACIAEVSDADYMAVLHGADHELQLRERLNEATENGDAEVAEAPRGTVSMGREIGPQ